MNEMRLACSSAYWGNAPVSGGTHSVLDRRLARGRWQWICASRELSVEPLGACFRATVYRVTAAKGYLRVTFAAALLTTVLGELPVAQADGTVQAAPVAPCEMHLRVQLTSDVPDPSDGEVIGSLLSNHSAYQLSQQRPDHENPSVIALSLSGPGPETACREVLESMRQNPRVLSIELQQETTSTTPVQPVGTMHAGPDGDWILEPQNGVSYARLARDRYECDIWAVGQTGFDPTTDDGGVPPPALSGRRADYLRAEAACFQTRGYVMK